MRLSVNCMVRNDEATIFESLVSAGRVADQVVVFDTGSTDKTLEAVEAAMKELDKPFFLNVLEDIPDLSTFSYKGGSFLPSYKLADVRNQMVKISDGDWIWVVDADEVYTDCDADFIRGWVDRTDKEAGFVPLVWMCWDGSHIIRTADPPVYFHSGRLFKKNGSHGLVQCKGHFPGESYFRGKHQIVGGDPSSEVLRLPNGGYRHYECVTKPFRRRILSHTPFNNPKPEALDRRPHYANWMEIPKLPIPGPSHELNNPPAHMRI